MSAPTFTMRATWRPYSFARASLEHPRAVAHLMCAVERAGLTPASRPACWYDRRTGTLIASVEVESPLHRTQGVAS